MEELQAMQARQDQQVNDARLEVEIEGLLRTILSPEAKARLANVRLASPEKYFQIVQLLAAYSKQGQLKERITDAQLKDLLLRVTAKKRETNIKRI